MTNRSSDQLPKKTSSLRFWTVLVLINVALMIYPVGLYAQAQASDVLFPSIVMVGTAFVLAITDAVSAVLAFLS
jgi:hypothetical protein